MSLVLDVSCMMAILLQESLPEDVALLPDRLTTSGAVVPALWHWELANALLVASRRNRLDWSEFRSQLARLSDLDIGVDQDSSGAALGVTVNLAIRHQLTVYDAAYLELAIRHSLPLATLDKALAWAARAEAIEVIGG